MTRLSSPAKSRVEKDRSTRRRQQVLRKACILFSVSAAAAVVAHVASSISPQPQHTSQLTGLAWLRELLVGHPIRFYNMFGMNRHVFRRLCTELPLYSTTFRDRCGIRKEEQLAIFLRIARSGGSNRDMQERFQRSADTISR